jgi:hypothetical protein
MALQPGVTRRNEQEVADQLELVAASSRVEQNCTTREWLAGIESVLEWGLTLAPQSPVTNVPGPGTRDVVTAEFIEAGRRSLDHGDPKRAFLMGAYKALAWLLMANDKPLITWKVPT